MELKHNTCIYKIDSIYLDNASIDFYHLFLHCDYCGKTIKLCIRTENNIVSWLGGKKGEWIVKTKSTFPQYQPDEYRCSSCNTIVNYKTRFCPNCGTYMRGADNG